METTEKIRQQAVARVLHDQARQDALDCLFVEDGRDKKDHPMYSLYTGLYQSRS